MGDKRNAGGPEAGTLLGARHLLGEFRRELAVDGRDVDADLFEHPAMHHRHFAAPPRCTGMVGAAPGFAHKSAGGEVGIGALKLAFDGLECVADAVTQLTEPASGLPLLALDVGGKGHLRVPEAAGLAERLAEHQAGGDGDVKRSQPFTHGDAKSQAGPGGDGVGHPGAFAPHYQDVAGGEFGLVHGACGLGSQQHQPANRFCAPGLERGKVVVLEEIGVLHIVQPAALHGTAAEGEAGRMDDVQPDAEAGAKPQHCASILGDVGLVERKLDGDLRLPAADGSIRGWVIVSQTLEVTAPEAGQVP